MLRSFALVACKIQVPDQIRFCNSLFPAIAAELSGLAGKFSHSAPRR